jgi:hypothetical protein
MSVGGRLRGLPGRLAGDHAPGRADRGAVLFGVGEAGPIPASPGHCTTGFWPSEVCPGAVWMCGRLMGGSRRWSGCCWSRIGRPRPTRQPVGSRLLLRRSCPAGDLLALRGDRGHMVRAVAITSATGGGESLVGRAELDLIRGERGQDPRGEAGQRLFAKGPRPSSRPRGRSLVAIALQRASGSLPDVRLPVVRGRLHDLPAQLPGGPLRRAGRQHLGSDLQRQARWAPQAAWWAGWRPTASSAGPATAAWAAAVRGARPRDGPASSPAVHTLRSGSSCRFPQASSPT